MVSSKIKSRRLRIRLDTKACGLSSHSFHLYKGFSCTNALRAFFSITPNPYFFMHQVIISYHIRERVARKIFSPVFLGGALKRNRQNVRDSALFSPRSSVRPFSSSWQRSVYGPRSARSHRQTDGKRSKKKPAKTIAGSEAYERERPEHLRRIIRGRSRRTDRRIPGRISADAPDRRAASRTCRSGRPARLPGASRRIPNRTCRC